MNAVRCQNGAVLIADAPVVAGDGVEVRVRSSGIRGSDLHHFSGGRTAALGHEFAGILADRKAGAIEVVLEP